MKYDDQLRIYSVLNAIPRGLVTSYGCVATLAQLPRGARQVGRLLSQLPAETTLPWHRVLRADGAIAFPLDSPSYRCQKERLESEGVTVTQGKVDLSGFGWKG
ncbi:MAG: cysteine methyltransferase [Porticoccus sp.]|nr:MAG: cysteine methyltransferase [Porticoccus sp.]